MKKFRYIILSMAQNIFIGSLRWDFWYHFNERSVFSRISKMFIKVSDCTEPACVIEKGFIFDSKEQICWPNFKLHHLFRNDDRKWWCLRRQWKCCNRFMYEWWLCWNDGKYQWVGCSKRFDSRGMDPRNGMTIGSYKKVYKSI